MSQSFRSLDQTIDLYPKPPHRAIPVFLVTLFPYLYLMTQ